MDCSKKIHDVVIVGAGPAALSAAIYTTRDDLDTLLFDKGVIGGLAATTDWIDNYPGFPDGVSGLDLASKMQAQAERFGAKIEYGEVQSIAQKGGLHIVKTGECEVRARSVLIATGSSHRYMEVPGEQEYYGKGVHFCATCDGAFYRDKNLAVVGGGNSAVQEALFLTRFASHIDLLVRSQVKATEILQHELQKAVDAGKITVHLLTKPVEVVGDGKSMTKMIISQNDKQCDLNVDGVFVFIGFLPATGFLKDTDIKLDDQGFVVADKHQQTSMPGVFCAGDVRSGAPMQVSVAVGEGAAAALQIRDYLEHTK